MSADGSRVDELVDAGQARSNTGGVDHVEDGAGDISVRFAAGIPVRPLQLIAEGLGLPRAEVERLLTGGSLVSAVRLSRKRSSDFTFTLKR